MKRIISVLLAILLSILFVSCKKTQTPSESSDLVSSDISSEQINDETIISPEEITAETISFLGILNNQTWQNGEDINTYMYYAFYRDYINSITTYEERVERYTREEYPIGFVYPRDELETYVQKYFDVSIEHLRESDCYRSEDEVYNSEGGGGANIKYRVRLAQTDAIKIEGDIAYVKAELSMMGDFSDTEYKLYTLKKGGDGFKYLSCERISNE